MIRINLLPTEEKPSREVQIWGRIFVWTLIAAGLVLVVGVGLHIFRTYEISTLKSDIEETRAEQQKYEEQARLVNALTERRKQIAERIEVVEDLDHGRFLRVYLLDELARSVPEYVWLQRFNETGDGASIQGVAFSNLAISRFMDSLDEKTHVDSVYLRVIRRDEVQGTPVLGFEVGYRINSYREDAESS